jgi:hypothetical protein
MLNEVTAKRALGKHLSRVAWGESVHSRMAESTRQVEGLLVALLNETFAC